jgi:hypothetical protein
LKQSCKMNFSNGGRVGKKSVHMMVDKYRLLFEFRFGNAPWRANFPSSTVPPGSPVKTQTATGSLLPGDPWGSAPTPSVSELPPPPLPIVYILLSVARPSRSRETLPRPRKRGTRRVAVVDLQGRAGKIRGLCEILK